MMNDELSMKKWMIFWGISFGLMACSTPLANRIEVPNSAILIDFEAKAFEEEYDDGHIFKGIKIDGTLRNRLNDTVYFVASSCTGICSGPYTSIIYDTSKFDIGQPRHCAIDGAVMEKIPPKDCYQFSCSGEFVNKQKLDEIRLGVNLRLIEKCAAENPETLKTDSMLCMTDKYWVVWGLSQKLK